MKYHNLLRFNKVIKSNSLKLMAVYLASRLGMRHLSIRIDPVMGCNLRCRMCSFSNATYRKSVKGYMSPEEMDDIARLLFPKAFQVVIGCAAEPTLHSQYLRLIQLANRYKVPNVSMVTNGMNLDQEAVDLIVATNLQELIISMHGVSKPVYEELMTNASYDRFMDLLGNLTRVKREQNLVYPKVRLNFTVNDTNMAELDTFFDVFGNFDIHTLQIRPIRDLEGEYRTPLSGEARLLYQKLVPDLIERAKNKKISVIAGNLETENGSKDRNSDGVIEAVYCYISPNTAEKLNINWAKCSFRRFKKATKWDRNLFRALFANGRKKLPGNILNYEVYN